jgi:dipeptidyl-peptidase-4
MKNYKLLIVLLIIISINIFGQKKNLTLRQVTVESSSVSPTKLQQIEWITGTENYSFVQNRDGKESLFEGSANSKETKIIFTLVDFNDELKKLGKNPISSLPKMEWINYNILQFWIGDTLWNYNVNKHDFIFINCVKNGAENIDVSSKNYVAYTINNNLFVAFANRQIPVTEDKNENIINGQYVARNEFGIYKGTFWSPNSQYLAFYRKDQTMVSDYPIVNINYRPAKVENIKYPMAGSTSEQVKLGIYNLKTNDIVYLRTGEPKDHYLTGVTWDPDNKFIYIGILNRDQNHLEIKKFDIQTGEPVKTLFTEDNEKYVQPLHGLFFVKNHPNNFLWLSRRDGWNHLYLYNTDGTMIKKLTDGNWEVLDFDGFDNNGNNAYFTATKESPLDCDYYSINLSSGKIIKISCEPGEHNVIKNLNGNYFIDSFNSLTVPYSVNLVNENGKIIRNIFVAENPLKDFNIGQTKFLKLKSSDGFDLFCRMILPVNFDSTQKYPVLVYVYGGPGVQLITNSWLGGAGLWLNYMAEHGYLIFTLDNRGSANRGLAFEQVTFRHLGSNEIQDQALGVKYLKSLPYVDSTKFGVFGWSFGGFMTTSLMTKMPGLFKVAVAGGSVIDWSYYEVMYTERYMDTPQANPEGYSEANLLNYVQNLNGKLLMIHGTSDPVVVWQNDLMFIKKAIDLGIPIDYFVYPGQEHNVFGIDRYHLYYKITDYFNQYLK